jgi:hypothetical protein
MPDDLLGDLVQFWGTLAQFVAYTYHQGSSARIIGARYDCGISIAVWHGWRACVDETGCGYEYGSGQSFYNMRQRV